VTLRELPRGLPPDEAEKLRWQAFGHKSSNALASADALVRFVTQRGFVLTHPRRGLLFPSALEAVVGRPLLGRSFDERTALLEAWRRRGVAAGRLRAAAALGGQATLASSISHTDFLALVERREELRQDDSAAARRGLGHDAAAVCEQLAKAAQPLTQAELEERMHLRSEPGRARLRAAVAEAIRRFRACEVVFTAPVANAPPEAGADQRSDSNNGVVAYDLVSRSCAGLLDKACSTKPETARQRIATRYLRNVLVGGCHEMARVLGWSPDDTLKTLRGLESRKIVSEHPASRHNRWFFQVNATDLLA
jgi:hypothetical protein